jgi:hypothetical protein
VFDILYVGMSPITNCLVVLEVYCAEVPPLNEYKRLTGVPMGAEAEAVTLNVASADAPAAMVATAQLVVLMVRKVEAP